jgi:hypothetical protein
MGKSLQAEGSIAGRMVGDDVEESRSFIVLYSMAKCLFRPEDVRRQVRVLCRRKLK